MSADLFLQPRSVLSIDMISRASSGDSYLTGRVPPPLDLDLDLPDRRACLLSAAHAAAGWIRERRSTWTDAPAARPANVPIAIAPHAPIAITPPVASSINGATTDALFSTLAFDHVDPLDHIDPSADISAPAASGVPMPAVQRELITTQVETPSADVVHQAVSTPVETATSDIDAALANDLDLASAEAFAPFLAEERAAANHVAILQPGRDTGDGTVRAEAETAVAASDGVTFGRTLEIDAVQDEAPRGPSLGARLTQWARAGAVGTLRRWPAFATMAVLAVTGMSAWSYWPRLMAPKPGTVVLESVPAGSQVSVDGKNLGATPLTTTLSPGEHSVAFVYKKASRTMRVTVASGVKSIERVDWTRKTSGRLQVHSDPPGAKVLVDGVERGVTPLTLDDLTIGAHDVVLQRADGSVERSVTVNATDITRMSEMIFPGWVTVFSPFNLNITEGSRPVRLDDRNQVMLPSGSHELRFENRALGYEETRRVDIKSGAVTTLSIVPPRSSLSVTSNQPGEVWLDGTSVGNTPLSALPVELGTREIVVRTPDGDVRRFTITVTTKPTTLDASPGK